MNESPEDQFFQEKETHLSEYLIMLLKRRRLIILVFILTVLAAGFHVSSLDPVYQSSARLLVENEMTSSPITGERLFEVERLRSTSFNTSIEMMKSTEVLKEVISALKLDAKDTRQAEEELEIHFYKEWLARLKSNIRLLLKKNEKAIPMSPEERENARLHSLIAMLRSKITVDQIRDTQLLNISVRDKNPKFAAALANTLANKYMQFNLANKVNASRQTLEWLHNELYDMRRKLEEDERKFFEYKQQNMVFSMEGKQQQAEQRIQEFNARYLETRNKRLVLDSKINELNRNLDNIKSVANVRFLINNPVIEKFYARILDLEIELTRLSKVYRAKHPTIIQARTELEQSRNSLTLEIAKEVDNLKSERQVLYAREKTLETNIAEFEEDALDTSTKELEYTILQRNVDTSKNLYDLMVSRIKESNINQTADSGNIRLVETARTPVTPVSPNKKRTMIMSIFLGLAAGCGLAFFFEYMDRTIRTEEDIHKHFNLPVLSVIPQADKSLSYGADY